MKKRLSIIAGLCLLASVLASLTGCAGCALLPAEGSASYHSTTNAAAEVWP